MSLHCILLYMHKLGNYTLNFVKFFPIYKIIARVMHIVFSTTYHDNKINFFPIYMIIARVMHIVFSTTYHDNKIMFYSTQSYECHPINDSYNVSKI